MPSMRSPGWPNHGVLPTTSSGPSVSSTTTLFLGSSGPGPGMVTDAAGAVVPVVDVLVEVLVEVEVEVDVLVVVSGTVVTGTVVSVTLGSGCSSGCGWGSGSSATAPPLDDEVPP